MSRCIGCGAKIQTTNPEKIGYVPEIAMIERGEQVYCKRCYDIRHHNALYTPEYDTKMYYDKIKNIKDENALVILMIDIMDIFGGFIPNLSEYIGNNKVLIIVNKIDVLPKSTDLSLDSELVKSSAYLVLQLAEQGFMLQGVTIKFTDVFNSAPSNMNITVKSSKICLTDHADAFLNDFKFIQEIGDYSKRLDKLSTLLGEVITVILDVYDNRYLKIK